MKLKWFGHSCFLITSEKGRRVLTDPFDEGVGYKLPEVSADIVTTSHGHSDHNTVSWVKGDYRLINKPGSYDEGDIRITGVESFHDNIRGGKRGPNTIFIFDADGIRLCHCGDLGHLLTPEQIGKIGKIDVLMLPVGGYYTIGPEEAYEVSKQLKPIVAIPMHYKTELIGFPITGVDDFLAAAGGGKMSGAQEIEVTKDNIKGYPAVLVMSYK